MRGNTGLDSYEYDDYLASKKRGRELEQRKAERRAALKKDLSGYMFNIDNKPVKVGGLSDVRRELDRRGLAIEGEYKGRKR
jgi:hypothetical protein